ncbi:MAG: hypothetical protein ACPH15_00610 [Pseudomonadales bacterium]
MGFATLEMGATALEMCNCSQRRLRVEYTPPFWAEQRFFGAVELCKSL